MTHHSVIAALSVLVASLHLACSEGDVADTPDAASATESDGGSGACPALADTCPAGCVELVARPFHPERSCRDASERVIGCAEPPWGARPVLVCKVGPDGAVLVGSPGVFVDPSWSACDEPTSNAALGSDFCE